MTDQKAKVVVGFFGDLGSAEADVDTVMDLIGTSNPPLLRAMAQRLYSLAVEEPSDHREPLNGTIRSVLGLKPLGH